jgi:hypothetical protein
LTFEEAKKCQANPLKDLIEKELNYLKILRDANQVQNSFIFECGSSFQSRFLTKNWKRGKSSQLMNKRKCLDYFQDF